MSIFGNLIRAQSSLPPAHPFWFSASPVVTSRAGVPVSHETSLKVSAVWQGFRIIGEGVSKVPLNMYQRRPDGKGRDIARNDPLFDLLHTQPNPRQSSMQFREAMTVAAASRGRAYAEIVAGPRGPVDQLWPIPTPWVRPEELENNRVRYHIQEPNKPQRIILQEDMFYLEGPFSGRSLISAFAESVGLAVAAEGLTGSVYRNSARFPGALKLSRSIDDYSKAGRANIRESFSGSQEGWWNAGKTPIIEDDMDWVQIGMNLEDAAVVLSREFEIVEFARWLNIPAHRLMVKNTQPRANMEQEAREFVQETLMPWFARWEGSISRDLILRPERFFAEHVVEGLLRGDMATQANYFHLGIQDGWLNTNEVRAKINMNPIPGGDTYRAPANLVEVESRHRTLAERAARFLVERETKTMRKAYDKHILESNDYDGFVARMNEFYQKFAEDIASALVISEDRANSFVKAHLTVLRDTLYGERESRIVSVINLLKEWENKTAEELVVLAVEDMKDGKHQRASGVPVGDTQEQLESAV